MLIVTACLDGVERSLLVDTGAGHSLMLSEATRPNEVAITTQDALGQPLEVWNAPGVLELGGVRRRVPLLRAPKFDVLERLRERLGVPIDGLLGLTSIRALGWDPATKTLRVSLAGAAIR